MRALLRSLAKQLSLSPSSVKPWIQRRLSDPRRPRPSFELLAGIFQLLVSNSPSPAALDAATSVYHRMTKVEGYETKFVTDAQMLLLALRADDSHSSQVLTALQHIFSFPAKFTDSDFLSLAKLMQSLSFSPDQMLQITRLYVDAQSPSLGVTTFLARLLAETNQHDEALDIVSQYAQSKGRRHSAISKVSASHPFTAALAVSPASQPPSPAHIDSILATMSILSIPSDKSLLNVLILDQAMRAREAGKQAFSPRQPSPTSQQPHPLSPDDDPSSIISIWKSIHQPQTTVKQLRQDAHLAVEKAFTIYYALCQAHADSEMQEVQHSSSFRPDFYTYRILWNLLARRPAWKFEKRKRTSYEVADTKSEKTFLTSSSVDEYGFDLNEEPEEEEEEEGNSEVARQDTDLDSAILTPRALFQDMIKYHFLPSASLSAENSKHRTQNQLLLNTALMTFLNRSSSSGGPDYTGAAVALRCFRSVLDTQHQKKKTLPSIPLPIRTYRTVLTHLHQRVRDALRHSLGYTKKRRKRRSSRDDFSVSGLPFDSGPRKEVSSAVALGIYGNIWARWVLSMGAGDLRGFRELLSKPPAAVSTGSAKMEIGQKRIERRRQDGKDSPPHPLPPRPRTAMEKIVARLLFVSRKPLSSLILSAVFPERGKIDGKPVLTFDVITRVGRSGAAVPSQQFEAGASSQDLERLLARAWIATNFEKCVGSLRSLAPSSLNEVEIEEFVFMEMLGVFEREVDRAMDEMLPG